MFHQKMKNSFKVVVLPILSLIILNACNTGASESPISNAGTVSVNTENINVSTDQNFSVTFAAPIDVTTVTTNSFFMVPESSVSADISILSALVNDSVCDPARAIVATVSCSSATSCELILTSPLEAGTNYHLCLTSDIRFMNPTVHGVFQGYDVAFITNEAILESLTLSPTSVSMDVEDTQQFTVTGIYDDGTTQSITDDLVWSSSNENFVSIAQNGLATAVALGESNVTVTQSSTGLTASAVASVDFPVGGVFQYTVGGTISGLTGSIVLRNNGTDNLTRSSNGAFAFSTPIAHNATYHVTILTQPAGQNCVISNASETMGTANVTNVSVICTTNTYTVAGSISGLFTGYEIQLHNNGGDSLTVPGTTNGNASFTFPTALEGGAPYNATVVTAPQDCDVTQGSGTISTANVTNVTVTCAQRVMFVTTLTYNGNLKGGTASGVVGADAKCALDDQCPDGFVCQAMLGAVLDQERTACTTANCSGGGNSEHVNWVLLPSTAYVRSDGTTLVGITNENAIFDFNLDDGVVDTQQFAWIGLARDWTTHFFKCFSWTSSDPDNDGYQGEAGDVSAVNNTFLDFYNFTGDPVCSTLHPLVCVSNGTL